MSIVFMGKHRLCDGFPLRDMWDYVADMKRKLAVPPAVPAYAIESDARRIDALAQELAERPFDQKALYNKSVLKIEAEARDIRLISYAEFPRLYIVCEFAVKTLCGETSQPVIQTFRASEANAGDLYNAYAYCYLDSTRIYLSEQLFLENRMLEDAELCYLIGHEFGHARCFHGTANLLLGGAHRSDMEFSADRAGLLVAAQWLMREHHGRPVCETVDEALLFCVAALEKLMTADSMHIKGMTGLCDWSTFDYPGLRTYMETIQKHASQLGQDSATHPNEQRRYLAMKLFSESEKFYRCMGLKPDEDAGLYTDTHLREQMPS